MLIPARGEDPKKIVAEKPAPLIEEVPAPAINPTDVPDTKTSKGVRDALQDTKIGLIKKNGAKNCHVINGKVKCYDKKKK